MLLMRRLLPILLPFALLGASAQGAADGDRAGRWWSHVEALASDANQGRATGSPGYERAAAYVIDQFRMLGLRPAGTDGYRQPVALIEQAILAGDSSAALIGPQGDTPLVISADLIFSGGGGPTPEALDAPMVFAGYGLHLPEAGLDDFAGLDLKGKVVVVISGGPANVSGALKSHARSERAGWLAERGAVGLIQLVTLNQVEMPWTRRVALASQPAMFLKDPALRDSSRPFLTAQFDPAKSRLLFDGSGRDFAAIAAAADASVPVPAFVLAQRLRVHLVARRTEIMSPNIIAVLPGVDPHLKHQYVVLSAHLDGYGVGAPVKGDAIYNGALDNASGVASLIEIARTLRDGETRPARSILFAVLTAEEKGLLGSHYFARRPTVPAGSLVADLNFDMALPIFPLKSVTPIGYDQSNLGQDAAEVGDQMRLPITPDPFPDRNVFIRSDQYSFVREGIPALFFKYGFKAATAEADLEKAWRANIYHSPMDDTKQPTMPAEAVKLNDYVAAVTLRIANARERPRWNKDSFFRRFAK